MIVAIVGLTGSGKSTVADILKAAGLNYLRLGQITMDILREKGLEPTEENERPVREGLRNEYGMAAYAIMNFAKIDKLGNAVVDGLYSWEEYLEFRKKYKEELITLAVYASPRTRYARLKNRAYDAKKDKEMRNRPQSQETARGRDYAEIENINKAGPIAMADYTIINEGTIKDLTIAVRKFQEAFLSKSDLI